MEDKMTTTLELRNLSFRYFSSKMSGLEPGDSGVSGKTVFNNFSLKVERGARIIVRGRSGSGKTTLLRLMAWLEEPESGEILLEGRPYSDYAPTELRKMVSFVCQTPVMLDGSVRYNLSLGLDEASPDITLETWLERFGLQKYLLSREARSLSVGQQQRVAVIRNLLIKPKVLLLDEPTSGLDPESAELFLKAMLEIAKNNEMTFVWNSHRVADIEHTATGIVTINGEEE